jgi:PD-(D/E)XK nuclease family transposase
MTTTEKYVNPFTDFGFKKLFGTELNKDLLVDFLIQALPYKHLIKELTYARTEQLGNSEAGRKAVFDLYYIGENGDRFLLRCRRPNRIFSRTEVYYASFPI